MQPNPKKAEAAQAEQAQKVWNTKNENGEVRGRPKLTTPDASRYLFEEHGIIITPRTMANHAWAGCGPKFHKFGGRRYYGPEQLDEWALTELGEPRQSTSDLRKVGG